MMKHTNKLIQTILCGALILSVAPSLQAMAANAMQQQQVQLNQQLIDAAQTPNINAVLNLLNQGADSNYHDTRKSKHFGATGNTPLIAAAEKGNFIVMPLLLAFGAHVDETNKVGFTALMQAVLWGKVNPVIFLIVNGANVDAQDNNNKTALMRARRFGHVAVSETLISYGPADAAIVKEKVPLATLYDGERSPKRKKLKVKTS